MLECNLLDTHRYFSIYCVSSAEKWVRLKVWSMVRVQFRKRSTTGTTGKKRVWHLLRNKVGLDHLGLEILRLYE